MKEQTTLQLADNSFTAVLVDSSECCQHVNRYRHCVDARVRIIDGKIPEYYTCSWCGSKVEMSDSIREDILNNHFVIETGENGRFQLVEVEGIHLNASTIEYP